uniref:Uncharacterized LOC112143158 n=1 Tax=Oryzias melastigma TaxID=30732 RepID=A0A3B3CF22_ORYME
MNITNMSVQLKRKMNFFIVILGIWLLPKAEALKCYQCMNSDPEGCTDQEVECPSENHQCASVFLKGGSPSEKIQMKGCVLPEECNEYSAIYGEEKRLRISKCCNSDLCNTEPVPEPSEPVPNGLQCFGCFEKDCDKIVNCEGIQDHCYTQTMSVDAVTLTLKGCVSKNVCSTGESNSVEESLGNKSRCCQGNLCNAAPTDALKCYQCSTSNPGGCTDKKEEVQCPDKNHQCASVYKKDKYPTFDLFNYQLKGCVPSELCGNFSTDYGDKKMFKMIQCCNSDLCNGQLISEPESVPNGKTCCLGKKCSRTLKCEGNMDQCFTTTTAVLSLEGIEKGCTTKDHCALKTEFKHKYFGSNVTCCQGNNCNQPKITPTVKSSAITATASTSIFAGLLIFLVLFS